MIRYTSIQSYYKNLQLLRGLQKKIYEYVYNNQGCTKRECATVLNLETHNSARFTELVQMQLLEEGSERPCKITGNSVLTYYTTDKIKPKRKKKLSKKQQAIIKITALGKRLPEEYKQELRDIYHLIK